MQREGTRRSISWALPFKPGDASRRQLSLCHYFAGKRLAACRAAASISLSLTSRGKPRPSHPSRDTPQEFRQIEKLLLGRAAAFAGSPERWLGAGVMKFSAAA